MLFRRLRFSSDADIVRLTNARIIIIIIIIAKIQRGPDFMKHGVVFDPQVLITNCRRTPSSAVQNTQGHFQFWTEIAVYLGNGRR